MPHSPGTAVLVPGFGSGVVIGSVPGPAEPLNRVLLRNRHPDTGALYTVDVSDDGLSLDDPLVPSVVGERVVFFGRLGTVTAVDGGMVSLTMDPDPDRPGYPSRQLRFHTPYWRIHTDSF